MASLPLELLLLIISSAADKKDYKSLRNLSLACSAFREPSQSLLLSHIRVAITHSRHPGSTAPPGERLFELLSSTSKIVSYVKFITMFDPEPRWAGWVANDRKLARALDQLDLTKIEGLTLICSDHGTYELLDECLRATIVRICESPSLLTFSLSRAPLQLIWACGPSLKHFRVENSFLGGQGIEADILSFRESQVVSLDSLTFDRHSFPVSALQFILRHPPAIRVDQLRTLHLIMTTGYEDEDIWMRSLVKKCQNSLISLKLVPHVYSFSGAESAFRWFPDCPNLTTLEIEVNVTDPASDCLQRTVSFLERLSPSNAIQVLRLGLNLNLHTWRSITGIWGGIWSAELRRIGNCVTLGFPHLRSVAVEVHTLDPDDLQAIRSWIVEALAIPPETGLLDVA